ncbi:radical SAM/SPASM domain-containing protein [Clostridium perfringens]
MEYFVCEEKDIDKELSIDKKYNLPQDVSVINYKEYTIIVHPEGVSWLVTDNKGLEVFKFLVNDHSIKEALENFDEESVINIITQIEAKQFDKFKLKINNDINMYIYLTNNCNLRCKHCYMYSGDIKIEELSSDVWKRVIKEFADNGGTGITYTGGEVLLYKDFFELLKYSHELGIRNTILTNGVLWNEMMIKENKDYIDEVQVSLDGYDKESYYAVRKFDGFDKVINIIKLFQKYNVNTSVAVTPIFDKIDEFVFNFEKFAKSFIEKNSVIIKINLELLEGRDIHLTYTENKEYRTKLNGLVERLYPNFYESTFVLNYTESNCKKNCGFGGITLAANGDVYWCNQILKLTSSYNINDVSMKDIIKISEKMKEKTSVDNSSICKNCEIKYICSGGCRLKYKDIENADNYSGIWKNKCDQEYKNSIIEKMINCNEYFFVD